MVSRSMALTVPAASTFVMASWRQPGNCLSTSSRTMPDETASWSACISTPAASRAPLTAATGFPVIPRTAKTRDSTSAAAPGQSS